MASQKAQFDFRRYGRFLLIGAAIAGLYLCRDAGGCVKQAIDDFELSGARDNQSSKGIIGQNGKIEKGTEGDYAEDVRTGSTFFGLISDSIPHCTRKSSFSEPIYIFYLFWGLFGLGLTFRIVDRLVSPSWKGGVRDRAEEQRRNEEDIDRIEAQRLKERREKRKMSTSSMTTSQGATKKGAPKEKEGLKASEPPSVLTSLLTHEEDENAGRGQRPHSRYHREE